MEYGKAFTYMMEDADWLKKFLIGTVIVFVPLVGGFLLFGYLIKITANVINGVEKPLPEWGDFGDLIMKGLQFFGILFVYLLPLIIFLSCAQVAPLMAGMGDSRDMREVLGYVGLTIALCCGCLSILYGSFFGASLPAIIGQFAATGSMGAAFQLGQVFKHVRTQPAVYLIVWFVSGFANFFLALIGLIVCFIGIYPAAAYGNFVSAHLWGQVYRLTQAELGKAM
jgi:hypothetical protein